MPWQWACDHRCMHEGLMVLIGSCMHARHKVALMLVETVKVPSSSDDCTLWRVPSDRTWCLTVGEVADRVCLLASHRGGATRARCHSICGTLWHGGATRVRHHNLLNLLRGLACLQGHGILHSVPAPCWAAVVIQTGTLLPPRSPGRAALATVAVISARDVRPS